MNNEKKLKLNFPCPGKVWRIGAKIGKIIGKCFRSAALLLLGLIVVLAIFNLVPSLKELMPATAKLIEVILDAFDGWLMRQWFMANWF